MLIIKSFFKVNDVFIIAEDFQGPIADPYYIAGAIYIVSDDREIIPLKMWDYIDQFWAYITDGLTNIADNKSFNTCFPDQPIELSFTPLENNLVRISVKRKNETVSTTITKKIFLNTFIEAGLSFFIELERLLPGSSAPYPQTLEALQEAIAKQ